MTTLTIARVAALPDPLVINHIYIVAGGTPGGLGQIVVVGSTITEVYKTPIATDINSLITTAISSLDLGNSVLFAANITARTALISTLTKSSFIFVADATDDATVDSGGAVYFFNFADESVTKTTETESLDLVIPNKTILEAFSIIGGRLAYSGAVVSEVVVGTLAW